MAKKDKKKKPHGKRSAKPSGPTGITATGETRAAEVLTIGWMLATLATTAALVLGLFAYAGRTAAGLHEAMNFFSGLLLSMALASGLVTLALTWPVLRLRRVKPPRAITRYAVAIGLAPIVVVVLLQLVG